MTRLQAWLMIGTMLAVLAVLCYAFLQPELAAFFRGFNEQTERNAQRQQASGQWIMPLVCVGVAIVIFWAGRRRLRR